MLPTKGRLHGPGGKFLGRRFLKKSARSRKVTTASRRALGWSAVQIAATREPAAASMASTGAGSPEDRESELGQVPGAKGRFLQNPSLSPSLSLPVHFPVLLPFPPSSWSLPGFAQLYQCFYPQEPTRRSISNPIAQSALLRPSKLLPSPSRLSLLGPAWLCSALQVPQECIL